MTECADFDRQCMARALMLAHLGVFTTGENPRVGAVLAKHGRVIGEGYHRRAGEPHAEVMAMREIDSASVAGATCYVTLEPCSHQGKTGPCADALIASRVARVVVAVEDPNPLVAGQGIARLRAAGIAVEVGLCQAEAVALNPGFFKRMRTGLPWVWLKSAASLDGRTAMADGQSKWITGTEARTDVQRLRARCGAIVTGLGTLRADDPALTVRLSDAELGWPSDLRRTQPLRVLLDSEGRLPEALSLFDAPGEILWVTTVEATHQALQSGRMQHWLAPANAEGRVDLMALLAHLGERRINEVLFECGATLGGALIRVQQVDQGVLYLAGKLLGPTGRCLYDIAPASLAEAPRMALLQCQTIGADVRIDWRLER